MIALSGITLWFACRPFRLIRILFMQRLLERARRANARGVW